MDKTQLKSEVSNSRRPILISSFSNTFGTRRYFDTFPKNADGLAFEFKPGLPDYPENVQVFHLPKKWMGNTGRLLPVLDIIDQIGWENDRWYIFTDVADVYFQTEIPDLSGCPTDIIVSHEGKKFVEIQFWVDKVPRELLNQPAYNVGSFAMKGHVLRKFLIYARHEWEIACNYRKNRPLQFPHNTAMGRNLDHEIDLIFNQYADTVLFNQFLQEVKFSQHPTLFTCLSFQYELGQTTREKGLYCNRWGWPYAIVHANGSAKKLLRK